MVPSTNAIQAIQVVSAIWFGVMDQASDGVVDADVWRIRAKLTRICTDAGDAPADRDETFQELRSALAPFIWNDAHLQ